MFDIVDTAFSYGRGSIVCSSLQRFFKTITKENTLHVIINVDTAFLLCGAELLNISLVVSSSLRTYLYYTSSKWCIQANMGNHLQYQRKYRSCTILIVNRV